MNLLAWLGLTHPRNPLEVGDAAPNISARDEEGRSVHLSDFYDEGYSLIYFFPKADTPGCTVQACSLRDDYKKLLEHGVRVVGISTDTPASQFRFKQRHNLPFTLIADQDRLVALAFGVPLTFGMAH